MVRTDAPRLSEDPSPRRSLLVSFAAASLVAILGVAGYGGWSLYREVASLREAKSDADQNAVIGYENIHPEFCFAARPVDWIHDEGDETVLWAGWKKDRHDWFRVARGSLTREQVSLPFGRDVIRTIDVPIVEVGGGLRWNKIPPDALVAGLPTSEAASLYPLQVLEKVCAINDRVDGRPILVLIRPGVDPSEAVGTFEAEVDGERVTMGSSGYYLGTAPILYDRETRSLWAERDGVLSAVAGPLRSRSLRPSVRPVILPWSIWRARDPGGRLLVGADRAARKVDL